MDTSTDYMTALDMPFGIFLDCYETLSYISKEREKEMKQKMDASKNKK